MNGRAPDIGELAVDTASARVGTLTCRAGGTAWLRPPGGGLEWTTNATAVRPATAAERLSGRVAEANARSRGRLWRDRQSGG